MSHVYGSGRKEGARGGTLVPPRLNAWVEEGV